MLENKLKKNLADNLVRLRTERDFTQVELVTALHEQNVDITRTALASYENHRSFPKLDVLYNLARFFDTDIEALLEEKAEPGNDLDNKLVRTLDLNALLKDFSEVLMYFKMYRNMYFNLAEKVLSTFGTPEHHAEVLKMITGVYASEQLKLPKLKDLFSENLDDREILVFQGINNGIAIHELAIQLNTTSEAITAIFISAKDKVFKLVLQ